MWLIYIYNFLQLLKTPDELPPAPTECKENIEIYWAVTGIVNRPPIAGCKKWGTCTDCYLNRDDVSIEV